ncbi:hypothetical protein JMM81_12810 [Bacillus sp. V3B]|uniref:hypothetical protein n=1 Tax=Bacillus sp. V3B TaxID=2804915 RepID=UPI00210D4AC3|nr:hypothetical protein [Bacillus sp. V3B]MCQ6275833.1 hypothetical protein [Bacillus sp. V3B]
MGVCCGACHVELKNDDLVVLDDLGVLRHERCYDYANYLHLIDTVGAFESVRGRLPDFLISTYKQIIAMDEDEQHFPEEIEDEEVIEIWANMFKE